MAQRPAANQSEQFATFGELLKYLRRRAGLTQREFSIAVGYSPAQISRLEHNHRPPDRATVAARFVPVLELEHEPEIVARLFELCASEPRTGPGEEDDWLDPTSVVHGLFERMVRGRIVGREQEVGRALSAWSRAATGFGNMLLIRGEPGIGKSRLVRELALRAQAAGARVLAGECYAEGGPPYGPLAQVIRQFFDAPDAGRGLPEYVLADLLRLAPHLGSRFPDIQPNPTLDDDFERERLFDSFVTWCEALAHKSPVLMVVEDVHWADSGSLSLLRHLARRGRQTRLMLVATYRDSEAHSALAQSLSQVLLDFSRERLAEPLSLPRLNQEQTGEMLAALLASGTVSAELAESVFRESEGNPFFIEEICQALIEAGSLYQAQGAWRRRDLGQTVIPSSGRAAILSRIERLPASHQDTLRQAAAIGRGFDFDILKAASTQDEELVIQAIESAEQAQIISEESQAGGLRFTFAHALIPLVLRDSLSGPRLQRMHQRVARAMEALRPDDFEALAYHFSEAGQHVKAIDYLRRAGERAAALYAYDTAILRLEQALHLMEAGPAGRERLAVMEQVADLRARRGERAEAIRGYEATLHLWRDTLAPSAGQAPGGRDPWTAVRLHRKIIETFYRARSLAESEPLAGVARDSLENGLRLVAAEPPHLESVRLLNAAAHNAYHVAQLTGGDTVQVETYAQAAIEQAEQLDTPVELAAALGAVSLAYSTRGLFRERVQVAQRRLELSRDPRFQDVRERIGILNQASLALMIVGDYAEGLPLAFEAESLAAGFRDVSQQVYAMQLQAQCFFGLDRWDEVLEVEDRRKALEADYGSERVDRMCYYCGISANVMGWRGDLDQARERRLEARTVMEGYWGGPPETWAPVGHY